MSEVTKEDLILARLDTLEHKIDKHNTELEDYILEHSKDHAKQKGFLGGVVFVISGVWAAIWATIHWFK